MAESLRTIVLVGLIHCLNMSAGAQAPDPKSGPGRPASPSFQTPDETAKEFIAATSAKEWKRAYRCFAPQARDLVVAHLITMTSFVTLRESKKEDPKRTALEALLRKHDFDPDNAYKRLNDQVKAARRDGKPVNWPELVKSYAEPIKDKEALFVELLDWVDVNSSSDSGAKALVATVSEISIDGDSAKGTMSAGPTEKSNLLFQKVDGSWYLSFPDAQYQPSGWNDVFLFGHLDAIHHWRF